MKLIDGARRIIAYSLSFWMQVFGLIVLIAPEIRFAITGQDYDPALAWWLGALLLLAGLAGRLYRQGISPWREWLRILAVAAIALALAFVLATQARAAPEHETLAVAVPHIAQEEGKRNRAYRDIVGVWTICYGSTRGVHAGMVLSDAECLALLREEVAEYRIGLHRYFTPETKAYRLPAKRDAAYTSTAFNCGIAAIGRSTATRRLNAGDIAGGCQALTWWNRAGGRVVRGLVSRRAREEALCLDGLR